MIGAVAFWSLLIGVMFAYWADHRETGRVVSGIFCVFSALFFAIAFASTVAIAWRVA